MSLMTESARVCRHVYPRSSHWLIAQQVLGSRLDCCVLPLGFRVSSFDVRIWKLGIFASFNLTICSEHNLDD